MCFGLGTKTIASGQKKHALYVCLLVSSNTAGKRYAPNWFAEMFFYSGDWAGEPAGRGAVSNVKPWGWRARGRGALAVIIIIIIIIIIIGVRKVCCRRCGILLTPAALVCCSHFHPFLSLFLHYHYHHYDRSRRYYPNCPQHHRNIMQLMTNLRCGEEGILMQG